jgi:hypothetical protein
VVVFWGGELVSSPLLRCSLCRWGMPRMPLFLPLLGAINEISFAFLLLVARRCPGRPRAREP